MLIRSQDKTRIRPLSTCLEIYVRDCYVVIDGADYGEYSTHEKAIKVLDMICAEYQAPISRIIDGDEIDVYENIMFHMPQDDEEDLLLGR